MALIYMDSFDSYSTITDRWPGSNAFFAAGRFGNAVRGGTTSYFIQRSFPGTPTEVIVGYAYYVGSDTAGGNQAICLMENSTVHIFADKAFPGKLMFYKGPTGSPTLLAATSDTALTQNAWNYVEVRAKIDDAAGELEVRINGAIAIDENTLDTKNGGSGYFNTLRFFGAGGISTFIWMIDDLYVLDTTGSAPTNTFLGDCRVESLLPNGNGNSSDFVGSDADSTDNYLLVDETAPNGDTDYVESSSIGDEDTYAYSNLATTQGTIYGVQLLPYARKTDAGVRSIKGVTRYSGVEEEGADIALSTSWAYSRDIHELDPSGNAWTVTSVNAAEFGMKVSA